MNPVQFEAGEVLRQIRRRHTANELDRSAHTAAARGPRGPRPTLGALELSTVVAECLTHPQRELLWHRHFTPTSSSWLNFVEGCFTQLTNCPLEAGHVHQNVDSLVEAIDVWTSHWNDDPSLSSALAPAKLIIAKVKLGRTALS
jgi:hypothetical protein